MNRLDHESSLYLRQHADNPVHWHPWDDRAVALALQEDCPILLSIGYSACHWCHVMAHESFEDKETAAVMNDFFINIKVDREERPDLDRIYQLSHQLLTGRGGGWPLTVFLDPMDLTPFFAGTYFPPDQRFGMPAFRDVLFRVRGWFDENRDDIKTQNGKLKEAIVSTQQVEPAESGDAPSILQQAPAALLARHDAVNGGYGGTPKFPQAPLLNAIAIMSASTGPESAGLAQSLQFTLERMASSGLRDHLDGGFFRYCVDTAWTIPHFEKMLYDNAQLLPLYAEAAARWNMPILRSAAEGIADWLLSVMHDENTGFAASIDADAGGEEGAFHVWRRGEIEQLLSPTQFALFEKTYGLDGPPNFESRDWHLVRRYNAAEMNETSGDSQGQLQQGTQQDLVGAREILLRHRADRVAPTVDEKRLTSWNALVIEGLVRAAQALERDDWLDQAGQTLEFIRRELWRDQRLLAVYNASEARLPAYLDDYAYLLKASLLLLQSRFSNDLLDFSIELADALLNGFEDREGGGFFFSDISTDVPITRSMSFQDDATPAGNAVASTALSWLGQLTGEQRYTEAAARALSRALPHIRQSPAAYAGMLAVLYETMNPRPQLIISGKDSQLQNKLKGWVKAHYQVNCYQIDPRRESLPGILAGHESDEPLTAWLCRNMSCLPPVHSRESLKRQLEEQ